MSRRARSVVSGVFIAALIASVYGQVWVLPTVVRGSAEAFPEVTPLVVPAIVWGVVTMGCLQAVAVLSLRIIRLVAGGRFGPSRFRLLYGIIACLVAFLALVVAALWALTAMQYATPGVILPLVGGGLAAMVAVVGMLGYVGPRLQARTA